MKNIRINSRWHITILFLTLYSLSFSQTKGLKTITEKELRYHLEFLGAKEFRGRETPSPELEIATLYIGNWAREAGLKPILKDGSFYQSWRPHGTRHTMHDARRTTHNTWKNRLSPVFLLFRYYPHFVTNAQNLSVFFTSLPFPSASWCRMTDDLFCEIIK